MSVELLLSIAGAVATIVAGFWALAKLVVVQFEKRLDDRFQAQDFSRQEGRKVWDQRFARIEGEHRKLERDVLEMRADLPLNYVRREDQIRESTVINAKLDALASKIDLVAERQQRS